MSMNIEQRVFTLERQVHSLRTQVQRNEEWLETLSSPPWKRLWWFVQGFRLWSLGRWRERRWRWEDYYWRGEG